MSVTRWDVFIDGCYSDSACRAGVAQEAQEEGDWVKYDHHAAEVGRLEVEVERLRARIERFQAEINDERERHDNLSDAISQALAPLGSRYLDPPDGGSVDMPEFVERAVVDLLRLEARVPNPDDLRLVLDSAYNGALGCLPSRFAATHNALARVRATMAESGS